MNADGLVQVRQLRALSGPRPGDGLIQDMRAAVARLDSILSAWATFPPHPRTLQDAENTVEGLRTSLIQLRATRAGGDA